LILGDGRWTFWKREEVVFVFGTGGLRLLGWRQEQT
jgi:hypothetical protein